MKSIREVVCQMKPYIQPFERILAFKELETLSDARPIPQEGQFNEATIYHVQTQATQEHLAERLTYWEQLHTIEAPHVQRYTRQVRREATVSVIRNGASLGELQNRLPFGEDVPIPGRRNLRYGPHGIHEYRGKFFPQLVRSLLNITGVEPNASVLDPMCGSGTTPVETSLLGCRAIGVDINPLSVLMSRTKCNILLVLPDQLLAEYEALRAEITSWSTKNNNPKWFNHLSVRDREYLTRWFSPKVIAELDPIALQIHKTKHPICRALFQISLSNILRRISWQKNDDLRVRKENPLSIDMDVSAEFLTELERSVRTLLAFLFENQGIRVGKAEIIEGDTRQADQLLSKIAGKIDTIITSPPYATALPYLDTDRLSLCYLDLLSRPEHRKYDYMMIGNREITNGHRKRYWEEYQQHRSDLPEDITSVIDRIFNLNRDADVGFRRRNLPALPSKIFLRYEESI